MALAASRSHVEVLGYEAFFMSGSQVAAYVYGYPDVGLLGLNEMVESVRRMPMSPTFPYSPTPTRAMAMRSTSTTQSRNTPRRSRGLHIEDQESPKKSGTLAGRRLISREEAVGKYKAAVAAKELDPDFVICARCDSIGSGADISKCKTASPT